MADNEISQFPHSAQPASQSPKLHIYRILYLLNQGVDSVAAALGSLAKFRLPEREYLRFAQNWLEELRAGVNAEIIERLSERERCDEGRFWKLRRTYEKRWRDPDDVYIDVERREKERLKQGLAPRIGLIREFAKKWPTGRVVRGKTGNKGIAKE